MPPTIAVPAHNDGTGRDATHADQKKDPHTLRNCLSYIVSDIASPATLARMRVQDLQPVRGRYKGDTKPECSYEERHRKQLPTEMAVLQGKLTCASFRT